MSVEDLVVGDLDRVKKQALESIKAAHCLWGEAAWLSFDQLMEICFGARGWRVGQDQELKLRLALWQLVEGAQIKKQVPVNTLNPNYQLTDPLQVLAGL